MSLQTSFNVMCRTCLTETTDLKSLFILENCFETETTSFGNLLMSFASVQIIEGDGLPKNICLNCLQVLNKVVSFRKLCERSDETLRLWLATSQERIENSEKNEYFVCNGYLGKKEEQSIGDFPARDFHTSKEGKSCGQFDDKEADFESVDEEFVDVFNTDDVKGFISNSEHKIEEEDNKLHSCHECSDKFSSQEMYRKHMTTAHLNTFSCEFCGKIFKVETSLRRHLLAHDRTKSEDSDNDEKPINKKQKLPRTCTICNKTFRFHSNLERHKLTHTGEKPFLCNVCGKSFTQLSYLKIHSFIHTGEKPYKCQMCERCFGAPGTLMTHIRTHTGERPHVCKICGKDFPQSGYLSAHIRTHTGEKPAECNVCHRRFNQRGRLTIHMRMHSGEKPYTCKECGRGFAVKGTLKKHMRIHTGERPYICSVCGQAFTQSGTLATHMKVHKPKLVQ